MNKVDTLKTGNYLCDTTRGNRTKKGRLCEEIESKQGKGITERARVKER